MGTTVVFQQEPTNLDYLMTDVRLQFGDFDGSVFSDTIVRTSLVSGVRLLQNKWNGKYQLYTDDMVIVPQPSDVPAGYLRIASLYGRADIPEDTVAGSVFRNPFGTFTAEPFHIFESVDEQGLIFAAVYILRKMQVSSSAQEFIAWSTEDIKYSNLGIERSLGGILKDDIENLKQYLKSKIATPKRSDFPLAYTQSGSLVPQLQVVY